MCGLSTGAGVNSSSEMSGIRLVWLRGSSCICIPLFPILDFQEGGRRTLPSDVFLLLFHQQQEKGFFSIPPQESRCDIV